MKDRKINVDRPQLKANEILQGKDFEAIVRNHQFMSKPFYKQTWFYGTTGLASIGLIIGGTVAFQNSNSEYNLSEELRHTDAPPNLSMPANNLLVSNESSLDEPIENLEENTIQINPQNISPIEEKTTLEKASKKQPVQPNPIQDQTVEADIEVAEVIQKDPIPEIVNEEKPNKALDMFPRISDKIGGSITRNELFNNKGITTEGDISIIHFELHLIDGLGGKVYAEEGNQLNEEMMDALQNVSQGETIYFENIRGKVKNGKEVRLNPLRYVLMN
ncbi:hypothetical protein N8987_04625 [Crocinitomix sp.]|nr:hypothetical protein [Crocinitomix sp.]